MEGGNERKLDEVFGVEDWGEHGNIDSLGPEDGSPLNELMEGLIFCEDQQLQSFSDDVFLDNLRFDALSPSIEAWLEEIANLGEIPAGIQDTGEHNDEENHPHATTSVELLKSFGSHFKLLNGATIIEPTSESIYMKEPTIGLSTEEIIRVAGKRFIQSYSRTVDIMPILSNPFDLSLSGLSSGEIENIDLVYMLLASAEKVSNHEYEHASKLLSQCDHLSSRTGNSVERVVYYFSEALQEKINQS
ncbi:uncharacterized protein LOC120002003 [Tripterygium wilfordii]|uniref:uncharacterized protein LOC120002003 n=1 Tax=Tripterygium wilfordii TaxID=458696 RepID=UPI0018F82C84|nr:uncharacterized protein LOC120002003 [Tripterygium wilfordii]